MEEDVKRSSQYFPGSRWLGICRGHGFDPWLGNWIPRAEEQLSQQATTEDPVCHNWDPVRPNKQVNKYLPKEEASGFSPLRHDHEQARAKGSSFWGTVYYGGKSVDLMQTDLDLNAGF